jgi:hypothetical protein
MNTKRDTATDYTFPEDRGVCGFCGKEENGYAKRDANGEWQAACWLCVRPENSTTTQSKRATVGTVFTDVNTDEEKPTPKKVPGLAPSSYRPKVN